MCVCVGVGVCRCECVGGCGRMFERENMYMYVCVKYVRVCLYVRMCVCMCVSKYVCLHTHEYICTRE